MVPSSAFVPLTLTVVPGLRDVDQSTLDVAKPVVALTWTTCEEPPRSLTVTSLPATPTTVPTTTGPLAAVEPALAPPLLAPAPAGIPPKRLGKLEDALAELASCCFWIITPPPNASTTRMPTISPLVSSGTRRLGGSSAKSASSVSGMALGGAVPSGTSGRCDTLVPSSNVVVGRVSVTVSSLVETKRVDRTQGCGSVGRIDAEDQAHGDRDPEREGHRIGSDHGLDAEDLELGTDDADHDPDQAAEDGQHGRLEQELADDVAASGADRLANADLARALRDAHQHDVHDPDAADEQRDRGDDTEQDGQGLA